MKSFRLRKYNKYTQPIARKGKRFNSYMCELTQHLKLILIAIKMLEQEMCKSHQGLLSNCRGLMQVWLKT